MNLTGRPLITHSLCLAVGLAIGIYLTRPSSNVTVSPTPATEGDSNPSTTDSAPARNSTTANGVVNTGRAAQADGDDTALIQMQSDYNEQIRKGESRQALLILQEMEKKAPHSRLYLETNSDYQVYAKDWPASVAAAAKCVAAFPASRACFRNRATAELQTGSKEDQAAAVDACLALEPNDPQCRNMKGMVFMNAGEYPSAIALYQKLIHDNGSYGVRFDDDHLEWQLGLALEGAGRRDEAVDHMENACRRNNNQACKKIEELSGGGIN